MRSTVWSVGFDPSGKKLVSGSSDKTVKVWSEGSSGTFECQSTLDVDGEVFCVSYSPDGEFIAAGYGYPGNAIQIFKAQTGEKFQSPLTGHTRYVPTLALLVLKVVLVAHSSAMRRDVNCVGFDPTGKKLVSCSDDRTVRVWDATTGEPIGSPLGVDAGASGVQSVSFSPKDDVIAAGCSNGKIYLVDALAGEVKSTLAGHSDW